MCPKPRFNMPHWYLLIESSQSRSRRSSRIAMYQHEIRLYFFEYIPHTGKDTGSHII